MTTPDKLPVPPAQLKQRVTASLRDRGVLQRTPHWSRLPLAIAAGAALFLAGTQWPRLTTPNENPAPTFALLLYEDAAFHPAVPLDDMVREYTAWARTLAERGDLVLAEALDPLVQVAGAEAPSSLEPLGQLTGMFVVHAADRAAALALARNHPHVSHGGRVVVRGVLRH